LAPALALAVSLSLRSFRPAPGLPAAATSAAEEDEEALAILWPARICLIRSARVAMVDQSLSLDSRSLVLRSDEICCTIDV
jgi:hypothetical protein